MKKNSVICLKLIFAAYWSCFLLKSDAYYTPYLAVAVVGCMCMVYNNASKYTVEAKWKRVAVITLAFVLAFCVAAANYKLFESISAVYSEVLYRFNTLFRLISMLLVLFGGIALFGEILTSVCLLAEKHLFEEKSVKRAKISAGVVFLLSWLMIAALDLFLLFSVEYPGVLTADNTDQVHQLLHFKQYSNHHPFYHTQIIHIMISVGLRLFGDMSAATALYSVFSILVMSGCFAYTVYTVYQLKHSIKAAVLTLLIYLLMPYHIKYSYTMWKDVFFGAAVLVFVVGAFRVFEKVGKHERINYAVMLGGAFGMTLLRSNGLIAFVATVIVFALLFRDRYKRTSLAFAGIIVLAFVLKHPVLTALNVKQPDTVESLSIPIQQIARVITDGMELTSEQEALLSNVVNIEDIPDNYKSYISDPIKNLIRNYGNKDYINENKTEFIKLYVQLGLEHPREYIRAWIDQTKGYWNSGYSYWIWGQGVNDNLAGIEANVNSKTAESVWQDYLREFTANTSNPLLLLFVSIGFNTWLVLISAFSALIRKDFSALFVSVPTIMVIATLLIATPVYSEFRYAYAMFCCQPFIVYVSFMKKT